MVSTDLGACEWFVWDLQRSGLIDRGQLEQVVGEFLKMHPRAEPQALAEYLVGQEALTHYQAQRILDGKTQGLVLGPYVLLDTVGAGSMGQVYKAVSRTDNQLYAVKVLPRRSMWNVRLARRQVRAFSQFTHPAVVPFTDVGTSGGLHYLVWPFVEGETLESMINREGPLDSGKAAVMALQISQGLNVSHQHGLFHGLLKPSNVMIGADGQARVLDFGIGSLLVENEGESLVDTMSAANSLCSGLDCCAPECIVEPSNRTPAGDQYSLGCALYFTLSGRYPFPEGSAVEKMMAHQSQTPPALNELAPGVDENLVALIDRLMAKEPEQRFNGTDEVVEQLEPLAGDAPKAAPAARPRAAVSRQDFRPAAAAPQATPTHAMPTHPTPTRGNGVSRPAAAAPGAMFDRPAPPRPNSVVPPQPAVAVAEDFDGPAAAPAGYNGPGGWVPEEAAPRFELGQTGMMVVSIAVVALSFLVASIFLFR